RAAGLSWSPAGSKLRAARIPSSSACPCIRLAPYAPRGPWWSVATIPYPRSISSCSTGGTSTDTFCVSAHEGWQVLPRPSIAAANDRMGRGPGPGHSRSGMITVDGTATGRPSESRDWTSSCQVGPVRSALNQGMVAGRESSIVPSGVDPSSSGGSEYQGSGEGLGRYSAGSTVSSGSESVAGSADPAGAAGCAAALGTTAVTSAAQIVVVTVVRAARRHPPAMCRSLRDYTGRHVEPGRAGVL